MVDPKLEQEAFSLAWDKALEAQNSGEVPIGASLVYENRIIAAERNRVIETKDPTAHAELLLIRKASKLIQNERLPGAVLYSTLEPCAMCTGALILARVAAVHFLAFDQKLPALRQVAGLPGHNHHLLWEKHDLPGFDSSSMLSRFFKEKRNAKGLKETKGLFSHEENS